jgi:hypothetical protein
MKKLITILLLMVCLGIEAAPINVLWNLSDFSQNPVTNRTVKVQSFTAPTLNNSSQVVGDFMVYVTDNTGAFTMTNVVSNLLYQATILAPPSQSIFTIYVPPGASGNTNASFLTVANSTATFPSALVAWSTATADLRYLSQAVLNGFAALNSNQTFTLTNNFTGALQLNGTNITNLFGSGGVPQTPLTNNVNGAGNTISNASFIGSGSGLTGVILNSANASSQSISNTGTSTLLLNLIGNTNVGGATNQIATDPSGMTIGPLGHTVRIGNSLVGATGDMSAAAFEGDGSLVSNVVVNATNIVSGGKISTNVIPPSIMPLGGANVTVSISGLTPTITVNTAPPSGIASGDLTNNFPSPSLVGVIASGTATKVTYDTKGRVISTNVLANSDLPASGVSAGSFTKGTVNAQGIVTGTNALLNADLPTSAVTPGIATKVTVNSKGIVTGTNVLIDADIPAQELRTNGNGSALTALNGSQITSGTVATNVLPSALIPVAGSGVTITVSGLTATINSSGGGSATNAIGNLNGLGTNTSITQSATNTVGLSITSIAANKTNLLQIQDSASNPLLAVGAQGGLAVGNLNLPGGSNIYAASNILSGGSVIASNNARINGTLNMLSTGGNAISITNSSGIGEFSVSSAGVMANASSATVGTSLTVNTSATFEAGNAGVTTGGHFYSGGGVPAENFLAGNIDNSMDNTIVFSGILSGEINSMINASDQDVIAGGQNNSFGTAGKAFVDESVIAGGESNIITSSVSSGGPYRWDIINGGLNNAITNANYSSILGGGTNYISNADFSIAAGENANVTNTNSFVWNDSSNIFSTTSTNQFLIHAGNGVGINTNNPGSYALNVHGTANIDGGISDSSLSTNIPRLNGQNTFGGTSNVFNTPVYFTATNLNVSGTSFENNTVITNNLQYLFNTNHAGNILVVDANGNVSSTNKTTTGALIDTSLTTNRLVYVGNAGVLSNITQPSDGAFLFASNAATGGGFSSISVIPLISGGTGNSTGNASGLTNAAGAWLDATKTPYNAVGNGVTDDTTAITNALWAGAQLGLPVMLPMKTYKVSPFTMFTNEMLFGMIGSKLLFSSGSSGVGITLDSTSTNISISGLEIDGGNTLTIPGSDDGRTGIYVQNAAQPNWCVRGLYIHGFGKGMEVFSVGANVDPLAKINDCQMEFNWTGLKVDGGAEYISFTGMQCTENHFGCIEFGGNNTFSSCNFSRNNGTDLCLDGTGGGNPGHCSFSACAFNHGGSFALTCSNNSFGAMFSSCAFLPPNMFVTNSQGLSFNNCMMGWNITNFAALTFTNSSNCAVLFPQNPYGLSNSYVFVTNGTTNIVVQLSQGSTNGISIKDAQLSANVPLINANNAFTGQNTFVAGSGSVLTLGAVAGPSIFLNAAAPFTFSGAGANGFQWNNQANNTALMTLDNSGNLVTALKVTATTGLKTTATTTAQITSTGYTNSTGVNGYAYVKGTAVTYTNFDGSGAAYFTNTTLVNDSQCIHMQAGASITAASGLSGTFHVE